jgi:hypothetical protein
MAAVVKDAPWDVEVAHASLEIDACGRTAAVGMSAGGQHQGGVLALQQAKVEARGYQTVGVERQFSLP